MRERAAVWGRRTRSVIVELQERSADFWDWFLAPLFVFALAVGLLGDIDPSFGRTFLLWVVLITWTAKMVGGMRKLWRKNRKETE